MSMGNDARNLEYLIRGGSFSSPDPKECACGGSGWILHPFDVWYACPINSHTGPHPEEYYEEDWEENCGGINPCTPELDDTIPF